MTTGPRDPRHLLAFDTFRLPHHLTDVLVVGAGVAGLAAALAAARAGRRVMVLSKGALPDCNTARAQGGVAAVVGPPREDTVELHARDTLEVGQGLGDPDLVRRVVGAAESAIADLTALGARFDRAGGEAERGLEGGHSAARILHAGGDRTGQEIRDCLAAAVARHPQVVVWSHAYLVEVLTDPDGVCRGALVHSRDHLRAVWAASVLIASGGYGQVYRETTNWPGATGDGIAAAWRAGAALTDLEFVQFHPTTLYLAGVPRMLLTEAIRGEGAHIVDDRGRRFLPDLLERAELAPRDQVSRAIVRHLQRPGVTGVFLDLTHLDPERVSRRFPGVVASCRAHGIDPSRDRIPIRPAAHYSIGGIRTGADGSTTVPGLLAAGEAAATGLHGANRLASNSLLEGLVMGRWAGETAARHAEGRRAAPIAIAGEGTGATPGFVDEDDLRASLKALLWREAGIERNGANLTGALGAVSAWEGFALKVGSDRPERWTLLNMLLVARQLVTAALLREESRGTHHRRDFPDRDDARWRVRIVLRRGEEPRFAPVAGNEAATATPPAGRP